MSGRLCLCRGMRGTHVAAVPQSAKSPGALCHTPRTVEERAEACQAAGRRGVAAERELTECASSPSARALPVKPGSAIAITSPGATPYESSDRTCSSTGDGRRRPHGASASAACSSGGSPASGVGGTIQPRPTSLRGSRPSETRRSSRACTVRVGRVRCAQPD